MKKFLVFRMSSLGDIVLSTSFLENLPEDVQVDWVISTQFDFVLKGHPRINELISFDKKDGLFGWLKLVMLLSKRDYDSRIDLHRNLRSTIAFLLFKMGDISRWKWIPHLKLSKERLKTALLFLLKSKLPKGLCPTPYWARFAKVLALPAGHPLKPPSYHSILGATPIDETIVLRDRGLEDKKYFAVMPAASTPTKEWSPERYLELVSKISCNGLMPVLVGRMTDLACISLKDLFVKNGIRFQDALHEPNFKKTAILLKHAEFYIGSDTGLAHLAESVGTKSFTIFGPTRAELGFGPWKPESKSIKLDLWCSPCSKDGKFCYRLFDQYACLKKLSTEHVEDSIR